MTRMSSASAGGRPESTWRALLVLLGALIPALIAVLPLTLGPAWYLSADENEPFLTGGRVVWMLVAFTIAISPFLATAVSLFSARAAGQDWARACRIAAWWAFGFGCFAFVTGMAYSGGF